MYKLVVNMLMQNEEAKNKSSYVQWRYREVNALLCTYGPFSLLHTVRYSRVCSEV